MNGLALKMMRVRAGLTQFALSKMSGVHPSRISEMERNQRPVSAELAKILEDSISLPPPGVST